MLNNHRSKTSTDRFRCGSARRWPAALAVVLAAALVAACGSDGGDATSPSSAPTTTSNDASIPSTTDAVDADTTLPAGASSAPTTADSVGADTTVATGPRTIATMWGDVTIPADLDVIVAMDEYSAINLLAMGFTPRAAFTPYHARVAGQIAADAGVELIDAEYGAWNYEAVAAFEPDLITLVGGAETEDLFRRLSEIAPTVVIPHVEHWTVIVDTVAAMTGQEDRAERLRADLEDRIAAVAASVESPTTVGVLASSPSWGTYTLGSDAPMSRLLADVGYDRPAIEQNPSDFGVLLSTSPEQLIEHDADLLVLLGGDDDWFDIDGLFDLPTSASLRALSDQRWVEVLGEVWTSSDPFSVVWALSDLEAIQAGEPTGTIEDRVERWKAYLATLSGD